MSVYKDYQPAQSPSWLLRSIGMAWLQAFGVTKDVLIDRMKQAVKARFPLLAPPDALASLGTERGIDRGPSETDATYAQRVKAAWDAWPWAGTAYGVLRALFAAGYGTAGNSVYLETQRGEESTVDASDNLVLATLPAGSWQFDAGQTWWSNFACLVAHPFPTAWLSGGFGPVFPRCVTGFGTMTVTGTPLADYNAVVKIITGGLVGTATFQLSTDGGATFGSTTTTGASVALDPTGATGHFDSSGGTFAGGDQFCFTTLVPGDTSVDANLFRTIIRKWKAASSVCNTILVYRSGELWGWPHGTWGAAGGTWGGGIATTWTPPIGA